MGAINYEEQLDEMFEEQDEVIQVRQDERWTIMDMKSAIWADGIIHAKEQKIDEYKQIHQERKKKLLQKLDEWLEQVTKPLEGDIEFFSNHLKLFHMKTIEAEKAAGEKKISKTIKLPHHDLKNTKQQPEISINGKEATKAKDDPVFVTFVKENNPEFIKEEVKWGDYKKTLQMKEVEGKLIYVDDAGQPIEFIKITDRGEEFSVKSK